MPFGTWCHRRAKAATQASTIAENELELPISGHMPDDVDQMIWGKANLRF